MLPHLSFNIANAHMSSFRHAVVISEHCAATKAQCSLQSKACQNPASIIGYKCLKSQLQVLKTVAECNSATGNVT